MIYTALITYRPESGLGLNRIVPGYRAEVTDGLPDGTFCYTGVCETKAEVKAELIASLKALGLSGTLRFA